MRKTHLDLRRNKIEMQIDLACIYLASEFYSFYLLLKVRLYQTKVKVNTVSVSPAKGVTIISVVHLNTETANKENLQFRIREIL